MHLTYRKTCRVCGSDKLTPVIDLGHQHLQGSFVKPGVTPPMRKIPCELVRCDPTQNQEGCGLLQMRHTVPPSLLYSNYWYVSGTNQTMRDHLKGIALEGEALFQDYKMPSVLDIGCNDCTLLNCFATKWNRTGIDPSGIVASESTGKIRVLKDLFPTPTLSEVRFEIITSIAMFYDLEDPVLFACEIGQRLADKGTWIVEMSYMPQMLKMNSYDTICHEHLEYYSLTVLEKIFAQARLKCYRAELNDINGGSIRCYVAHPDWAPRNPKWESDLEQIRKSEFDLELDTDKPYSMFQHRVEQHREDLMTLLTRLKREGNSIHLYGASTKGNTLLQWCGIDSKIVDCAADRNPMKHGAMTIGTQIKIVSEEESRALKPNYYLVLPWHFSAEIIKREWSMIDAGTSLIFPLPKIHVVGKEAYDT